MSVEPTPLVSAFAEFLESLRGERARNEHVVRHVLHRFAHRHVDDFGDELTAVSNALDDTFGDLDRATEELRVQNEALFAARFELEDISALYQQLFELSPCAGLVTTTDTCIMYANQAACSLLGRPKNAFVGKPLVAYVSLEHRAAFRHALLRTNSTTEISEWPATLRRASEPSEISCRVRIRPLSAPGARIQRALYWNITEENDEDLF